MNFQYWETRISAFNSVIIWQCNLSQFPQVPERAAYQALVDKVQITLDIWVKQSANNKRKNPLPVQSIHTQQLIAALVSTDP